MRDLAPQPRLDAATAYEELFVPALFQQWAPRIADAVQLRPGQRVLDVACGTGVFAREAATRVGTGGSVAGLDENPGMLGVAERRAPDIVWRQGNAESLPYADRSFDAVVCQFGLMFFAHRRKALQEMLRVLAPDGRLAVAVWDSVERIPAYSAEVDLVQRLAGDRAADALRMPFALGNPEDLVTLIEEAGAVSTSVATVPGVARFPGITRVVEADLRGWLPLVGVDLSEERIQSILGSAEQALGRWTRAEGGGIGFDLSAHIATGSPG